MKPADSFLAVRYKPMTFGWYQYHFELALSKLGMLQTSTFPRFNSTHKCLTASMSGRIMPCMHLHTTIIALLSVLTLAACTAGPGENGQSSSSSVASSAASEAEAAIRPVSPQPNALVRSPLVVTGEARGTWYFEANFPVRLLDGHGREIAVSPAQAQGDWMTTEFVPYAASLTFDPPETATGTLVLEKDNPSGLPQNAAMVTVPVRFQ